MLIFLFNQAINLFKPQVLTSLFSYVFSVSHTFKSLQCCLHLSRICLPSPIWYLGVVYPTVLFLKSMVCFSFSDLCMYSFMAKLKKHNQCRWLLS